MKIFEIIMESGMLPIAQEPSAAMQNPTTFPGLNMNAGSLYTNYRFCKNILSILYHYNYLLEN